MPERKNNHIMPKCLIKQWESSETQGLGVHVYEIQKDKSSFSTGKGKRGYSFAIEPYFYVPELNSVRIHKVEKWLSSIEGTLATFLRKINQNLDQTLLPNDKEFFKLLLALFSLKNRTKYDIQTIREFLTSCPDQKKLIQVSDENDNEILVLENLIHTTTEEALEYANCEIIVCMNKEGKIILSDRPFLHKVLDGYSFVALSPYYFIAVRKTSKEPMYFYNEAINEDLIHSYNTMTAKNARNWIISAHKSILDKYIPYSNLPKKDLIPYYQEVKFLRSGYKIT